MTKKKVSEERGVELLDLVFDVVTAQVGDKATVEDIESGEQVLQYTATPALLTLAVKLLKDNQITLQPDDVAGKMSALEAELATRKRRSNLASVSPIRAEAAHG